MKFGTMKYCVMAVAGALLSLAGCVENRSEDYDPAVELAFRPQLYVQVRAAVPQVPPEQQDPQGQPQQEGQQGQPEQQGQQGQQGQQDPQGQPQQQGQQGQQVRAEVQEGPEHPECYPEELPFGVCAWLLPADESFADHAAEAREFLTRCRVTYNGSDWSYEPPKEWSPKSTRLSFIGYAPYAAAAGCDAQNGVTFADVDTSLAQTDLLYTDVVADRAKTECGGVVAMPFRHALCRVDFRIKNRVTAAERVVVRSITLDAAAVRGAFHSLPVPAWQIDTDRAPVRFFEGEAATDHTPRAVGRSVLMLPQELLAPVTVEFDYTDARGLVSHCRQSTKAVMTLLEAGRHYVYTLSVGTDDVMFLPELIEDHFM